MVSASKDLAVSSLIIFPGALGDLICLLPAIREIIQRAPLSSIELMARFELARFAVVRMGIARAHSIDRPEVSALFTRDGADSQPARSFFGGFKRIYCFFAAGDLQFRRSLSAIVEETGFYPFRPAGEGHITEAYLNEVGSSAPGAPRLGLQILPDDRERTQQITKRFGVASEELLLIFPGSGSPAKNWPIENFARVAKNLLPGIKPLVVLGPAEAKVTDFFSRRAIPVVTGLELGAVAGLASISRVFVGNDSGVSHLAAASGARGLVLFGPSDPNRWRPLGEIEIIRHQPLEALPVDEVHEHLFRLLKP